VCLNTLAPIFGNQICFILDKGLPTLRAIAFDRHEHPNNFASSATTNRSSSGRYFRFLNSLDWEIETALHRTKSHPARGHRLFAALPALRFLIPFWLFAGWKRGFLVS
jgi:hypothetical protein